MATEAIPSGMVKTMDRAVLLTRMQIEAALKLNAEYCEGLGMDHFGAILGALAKNAGTSILSAKGANTTS
jgi:hypothetical protein